MTEINHGKVGGKLWKKEQGLQKMDLTLQSFY